MEHHTVEILKELEELGFSTDEALLYLYLLQVKSASVTDIHRSPQFREKKRPNIYKVLSRLEQKSLVKSETKEGRALFFPVRPHVVLESIMTRKRLELEDLEARATLIESRLEEIFSTENVKIDTLDRDIQDFIVSVRPDEWLLREHPQTAKIGGSGRQVSVEFNTRRRFGGDAAGLVFFIFRYQEHCKLFWEKTKNILKQGMIEAFEATRDSSRFSVSDYQFYDTRIEYAEGKEIAYTRIDVTLNFMNMKGSGGIATILLEEYESWIVGVWGSSLEDFLKLTQSIDNTYSIFQYTA